MSVLIKKKDLHSSSGKKIGDVELKQLDEQNWQLHSNGVALCDHQTTKIEFLRWIKQCTTGNQESKTLPLEKLCERCYKISMNFHPGSPSMGLSECLKFSLTLGEQIGFGSQGGVYAIVDHPDVVVKIIGITREEDQLQFMREASFATLMGSHGVGPLVHASWICDQAEIDSAIKNTDFLRQWAKSRGLYGPISFGFILSERMEMTLDDFIKEPYFMYGYGRGYGQVLSFLENAIEKAMYCGYILEDLHKGNIMINTTRDPSDPTQLIISKVRIVDFGTFSPIAIDWKGLGQRGGEEKLKSIAVNIRSMINGTIEGIKKMIEPPLRHLNWS